MSGNRVPWLFALAGVGFLVTFYLVRRALLPFFVATVLAYLLAPLVAWLSLKVQRAWAVAIVLVCSLGTVGVLGAFLLPLAWEQVVRFVRSIPEWRWVAESRFGPWLAAHPDLKARLAGAFESVSPEHLIRGIQNAGAGILGVFLNLIALLLVPVILYYLLLEGPKLLEDAEGLIPERYRARVRAFAGAVHERVGGYIRGQLSVAAVMSLLQGVVFTSFGVPHAWLLGVLAGVANFVPYSPYVVAMVPAIGLVALAGAGWGKVAALAGVFTLVQKAEALYFTPVWVGRATRLHPLEVLLALLSFGFLFGILGLVFAVPLMIVLRVAFDQFLSDYRAHPWYLGEDA